MSWKETAGLVVGLLGLAGVGIPMIAPQYPWLGWIFIVLSFPGAIALMAHHFYYSWRDRKKAGETRKMIALVGMVGCGVGFLGFAAMYLWPVTNDGVRPSFGGK